MLRRAKRVEKCTSSEEIHEAKEQNWGRGKEGKRGMDEDFSRPEINNNIRVLPAGEKERSLLF